MTRANNVRPWWEAGVVYQIYPRSFQDSDGDGIGDLEGVRQRLDHIVALGADAIWLSPIFPSPMADFGYDVADYCNIDPMFGDLDHFDALLSEAHARGLKLLLDFVPNHTSDQHPWFIESRASRDNPKRDWYFWRDPASGGGPPNNWMSDMGGSAWEFDKRTGQYYLHAFLKEQADLNWRNPEVRKAMDDVLHFWFARGVDGFRIDVLWHCIKAEGLPDNPPNPDYYRELGEKFLVLQHNSANRPEIHAIAANFRTIADQYGDRLLVGEICLPVPALMEYYGNDQAPGVHLPFNFQLLDAPWDAAALAALITQYEAALPPGGWPNWVMGSHDAPRIAGRLGDAQARVAAMLLLTLRGTPTLYQGDELGIGLVRIPQDRIRDPQDLRQPGLGLGRDGARTPMAWDSSPHGGFSTAEPWLPLHEDWERRNVAAQASDANSMLSLYRRLMALRRGSPALSIGTKSAIKGEDGVLVYQRKHENECLLVALNLTSEPRDLPLPSSVRQCLASTIANRRFDGTLLPDEGVVLQLEEY
ncbi:alpha-amylase family glycosyl hydrolase [Novosphingobium sp. JCM 18896]|uniref:alpha-amylase family glycosyl hydrolase n=1 Tax=Novosphingobium sp. JCM 18896 TaxID=2989731 RepID=UPI0022233877|nr:alpha-amylase family glycosyl hydrolase [Novosphingobium sp. JCM 18896]MCW1432505.1 alpha-amylase family glycosyl hydrolase [Novosphingobium sp. JCM 18896]